MSKKKTIWNFLFSRIGIFGLMVLLALAIFGITQLVYVGDINANRFLLDTVVSINLYQSKDMDLLDSAFKRITDLEKKLSRYHADSDVSRINNASQANSAHVSIMTIEIIAAAMKYAEISGGAFDPTIGSLVDIWGIGGPNPQIPEPEVINKALALVDYRRIHLDTEHQKVFLEYPSMILDLGGIAKGWIADAVADYLVEKGEKHILINLGGNIRVVGGKRNGKTFQIGMQDPFNDRGSYIGIFSLTDGSVVTSGIYERFFEVNGTRYHHILDTVTGYPVDNELAAVTVISNDSAEGDALSTMLFVLGMERGLALVDGLKDVEAVFVTKKREVILTPGAAAIFSPIQEDWQYKTDFH